MIKRNKKIIIIGALAAAVLLFALVFIRMQKNKLPAEGLPEDITVETPYGTLYFPGEWQDRVYAEVNHAETVTVSFYGRISEALDTHLFDVVFGESEAEVLGTVQSETGEICNVGVVIYELNSQDVFSEKDVYEFDAMQEEINYVIERLPIEKKEQYSVPKESNAVVQNQRPAVYADVLLETPYVTIAYPGELAGVLHVVLREENPYAATFCWNKDNTMIRLFELTFGGGDGTLLGYLENSGQSVHLTVFDVSQEAELNQEELDTALELQESLNDVLARLPLLQNREEQTAHMDLNTPYGILCYPAEYQQHLQVEIDETDGYQIAFLFKRDNGETVPMFAVVFDGNVGTQIGSYTAEDGTSVTVSMVSDLPEFDNAWSEEEKSLYFSTAEGINYLFSKYEEMYSFEFIK